MEIGVNCEDLVGTINHEKMFSQSELDQATKLLSRTDAPWKITPADIADFYTLDGLLFRPKGYQAEDAENVFLLREKGNIDNFRTKLGIALVIGLLQEQMTHSNFPKVMRACEVDQQKIAKLKKDLGKDILTDIVTKYCSDYEANKKIVMDNPERQFITNEEIESADKKIESLAEDVKEHPENIDSLDFINAARYYTMKGALSLRSYISGERKEPDISRQDILNLATLMTAMFPETNKWNTIGEFAKMLLSPHYINPQLVPEGVSENNRSSFLIDRTINLGHNTGRLLPEISNDFPELSLVLLLHSSNFRDASYVNYFSSDHLKIEIAARGFPWVSVRPKPMDQEAEKQLITTINGQKQNIFTQSVALYQHLPENIRREAMLKNTDWQKPPPSAIELAERIERKMGSTYSPDFFYGSSDLEHFYFNKWWDDLVES